MATELASSVQRVRREIDALQEAALFTGEYDGGPALVQVTSGAGGTDAQDWAEMLLRMYLRWAEHRGYKAALIEATPGEEAGIKSATFTLEGDNAYGVIQAEKGVHRLVRLSPFDKDHRRHTAFASLTTAPWLDDDVAIDVDEKDLRIDTYRAAGRRRPARQQDGFRRPHHAPTDRHRRPVPERAVAAAEPPGRDARAEEPAARAGDQAPRGRAGQGARRGAGHLVRKSNPFVCPAPVHDGQRSPHGPQGRQASTPSSRATSTRSSASYPPHPRDRSGRPRLAPFAGRSRATAMTRRIRGLHWCAADAETRRVHRRADRTLRFAPAVRRDDSFEWETPAVPEVHSDDLTDAERAAIDRANEEARRRRAEALRRDGARDRRVRAPGRAQAERDDPARERHEGLPGQRDGPAGRRRCRSTRASGSSSSARPDRASRR